MVDDDSARIRERERERDREGEVGVGEGANILEVEGEDSNVNGSYALFYVTETVGDESLRHQQWSTDSK